MPQAVQASSAPMTSLMLQYFHGHSLQKLYYGAADRGVNSRLKLCHRFGLGLRFRFGFMLHKACSREASTTARCRPTNASGWRRRVSMLPCSLRHLAWWPKKMHFSFPFDKCHVTFLSTMLFAESVSPFSVVSLFLWASELPPSQLTLKMFYDPSMFLKIFMVQ